MLYRSSSWHTCLEVCKIVTIFKRAFLRKFRAKFSALTTQQKDNSSKMLLKYRSKLKDITQKPDQAIHAVTTQFKSHDDSFGRLQTLVNLVHSCLQKININLWKSFFLKLRYVCYHRYLVNYYIAETTFPTHPRSWTKLLLKLTLHAHIKALHILVWTSADQNKILTNQNKILKF